MTTPPVILELQAHIHGQAAISEKVRTSGVWGENGPYTTLSFEGVEVRAITRMGVDREHMISVLAAGLNNEGRNP